MARPAPAACRNSTRPSATACSSTPIRPTSRRRRRRRSTSRPPGSTGFPATLHRRGPRRRARHARVQFRARRPPRRGGQGLSRRQGRLDLAHEDDLLRQGAPGRDLRRHLLLVPEPPRGDGLERRAGQLTGPDARAPSLRPRRDGCAREPLGLAQPSPSPAPRSPRRPRRVRPPAGRLGAERAIRRRPRDVRRRRPNSRPRGERPAGGDGSQAPPARGAAEAGERPHRGARERHKRLAEQFEKFRQDVEFRFGDKSGAPRPAARPPAAAPVARAARRHRRLGAAEAPVGRLRPRRPARGAGRAAAARGDEAERPRPAPARRAARRPRPLELGKAPAAGARLRGPDGRGTGVAMLDGPRDQFNAALEAFQTGATSRPRTGSRRSSPPIRATGSRPTRSSTSARPISSAPARARPPSNISRSRPTTPSRAGRPRASCASARRSPLSATRTRPARPSPNSAGATRTRPRR